MKMHNAQCTVQNYWYNSKKSRFPSLLASYYGVWAKMKKILPILIVVVLFSSCGKKSSDDINKAIKKLSNMKSYSTLAEVTVIGNRGNSTYRVKQDYVNAEKLRLETLEPSFLKGKIMVYDGLKWKIHHPLINESYEVKTLEHDDQKIYLGVIQKSALLGKDTSYSLVNRNGVEYIEIKAALRGGNEYRKTVALFVSKGDYCPQFLEIYDANGDLRVRVKYTDFVYNGEVNGSLFE